MTPSEPVEAERTAAKTCPVFPLGTIVVTANAAEMLSVTAIGTALLCHAQSDWGDVGAEDKAANDAAVRSGCRLHSAYRDCTGNVIWVTRSHFRRNTHPGNCSGFVTYFSKYLKVSVLDALHSHQTQCPPFRQQFLRQKVLSQQDAVIMEWASEYRLPSYSTPWRSWKKTL